MTSDSAMGRTLIVEARAVTMDGPPSDPVGMISDAAIGIDGERIAFVSSAADVPADWAGLPADSAEGMLVLPGLIDSYRMISGAVVADADADADLEFPKRYRELVLQTAERTKSLDEDELARLLCNRIDVLASGGVTVIDVETGFGLTAEEEVRHLKVIRRVAADKRQTINASLLAGHICPDDVGREAFIADVETRLLPAALAESLADAVAVFCDDEAGLDLDESSAILEAAYRTKTATRVACDRYADSAGATLPPSFYSRAAIHLNYADDIALETIASGKTVAVLTPHAIERDRSDRLPDIDAMRSAGMAMAIAGDCWPAEPRSSDLLAAAGIARDLLGLTTEELMSGVTIHAAQALGLAHTSGRIRADFTADLAMFDAESLDDILSATGAERCARVFVKGVRIVGR